MQRLKVLGALGVGALGAMASGAHAGAGPWSGTDIGPNSATESYLEGTAGGVFFKSILTVNDAGAADNGYEMVGIPDGLGAYDNGDGTLTLLMNHELNSGLGVARAHGSAGAFVSQWVIRKSDLGVTSGQDLIQSPNNVLTGGVNGVWTAGRTEFVRLCSADLPALTAFYYSGGATPLGYDGRIFMNGEERGVEGRAFGWVATGAEAGTVYELPYLGKFSWENSVANPAAQSKTIVIGTDDTGGGQVYAYVGAKSDTGNAVERAGLNNGQLYGIKDNGDGTFTMVGLGDVSGKTGAQLQTESVAAGVTGFARPEDAAWDPNSPNTLYFATTNGFGSPSKLYKLTFADIANPELGGTIVEALDGTEGQEMLDNLTVGADGTVILQEDVGGNARLGKVWKYDPATDALSELAQHKAKFFAAGASEFITQDEESSGVIDVTELFAGVAGYETTDSDGDGVFYRYYLLDVQAHKGIGGALVEEGQLAMMAVAVPEPATYGLMGLGLGVIGFVAARRRYQR